MKAHGKHIKAVGYGSADLLNSAKNIENFLKTAVHSLGMRALGDAHVYEVEADIKKLGVEPFEDEGGVTGLIVLSTSHISIHTWPLRDFFVIDIYSCRDFETSTVLQLLESYFGEVNAKLTDLSESLIPPTR